ncbi:outer membrane beta-barrel protein [Fulvivirgaceae bacterium PWU5]|uniref:Outer membrane beta-barrel protein n=1 Tax=Dawidia cretensis TaxID=2782350 RepID=A0AAP2DZD4_9BACT|nr:porin family protein [Dawidia cretensis]MBT1710183.1 outer membrane beta-barrel protein [Dawidia cretensis]
MKKFLLIGAMALTAGFSYGQTIIPKAGITLSTFGGDDAGDDTKSKIGFTLGAGLNLPLGDGMFSLQPELNYVQKGAKAEYVDEDFNEDVTEKLTLGYLEIPVLVKVTFGEATKFYVNAGPSVGFGLGGKYKVEVGDESEDVDVKFGDGDDEDKYYIEKGTDIGLQLGAGVIVAEKVMIDIRYGLGLTDLYDDVSMKNNVFQFTVGIPLSIGGK